MLVEHDTTVLTVTLQTIFLTQYVPPSSTISTPIPHVCNPNPKVRSGETVKCRLVYPSSWLKLPIRICLWCLVLVFYCLPYETEAKIFFKYRNWCFNEGKRSHNKVASFRSLFPNNIFL